MEALRQVQGPDILKHLQTATLSRAHRARRGHRIAQSFSDWRHEVWQLSNQALGGTQMPIQIAFTAKRPSKLDELKAERFAVIGKQDRVARSLAALDAPIAIQVSAADWQWLDENSEIEDEFE